MQDKSSLGISEELRQYIEAVVTEVVLEGKSFEKHKKYLRRFCEAEGIDYWSLETHLTEFFECMEEYNNLKSKSGERLARLLAKDCFISDEVMEKLIGGSFPATDIPVRNTHSTLTFVDLRLLMRNGRLVEVTEGGRIITPCGWKYADSFHEGLARVEDEKGMGFIDTTGKVVIPCQWLWVGNFSEGLAVVENKSHKYFFIDKAGRVVITCPPEINPKQRCGGFHEGLAVVEDEHKRKYGYIDKSGKIVIPCIWNDAIDFEDGLAAVEDKHERWGCIDRRGRLVIPCLYDTDIIFCEGIANVTTDDYTNNFCIDRTGRKLFDWDEECNTICFKEGLASIEEYGFIDKKGNLVIHDKWSPEWAGFSEGLAPTEEGYIDHSGKVVISDDGWEECFEFSEGMAIVRKNDMSGYIDRSGRMIVPFLWDAAKGFHEGLACVKLKDNSSVDDLFYFINKRGQVLCRVRM